MLTIKFTTKEINQMDEQVNFTKLEKDIIQGIRDELSFIEMCDKLNISESKLTRTKQKIKEKIDNYFKQLIE